MLKLLSILALVVLSQSAFLAEEELKAPSNSFIDNVMKCIAEVKPVIAEVPEIIKALTDFEFAKAIELVKKVSIEVRVAAGQKTLPFEEDFMNGIVEGVAAALEKAIWQGDTSQSSKPNLNKFDGIVKIAGAATVAATTAYNAASISTTLSTRHFSPSRSRHTAAALLSSAVNKCITA